MLGATGTIGQATVQALLRRGHEVVARKQAAGVEAIDELESAHRPVRHRDRHQHRC